MQATDAVEEERLPFEINVQDFSINWTWTYFWQYLYANCPERVSPSSTSRGFRLHLQRMFDVNIGSRLCMQTVAFVSDVFS